MISEQKLQQFIDNQLNIIEADLALVHFAPFFRAKGNYDTLVWLIEDLALSVSLPSFRDLVGDRNPAHQNRPNRNDLLLDSKYCLSPVVAFCMTPIKAQNFRLDHNSRLDNILIAQDILANGKFEFGKNST